VDVFHNLIAARNEIAGSFTASDKYGAAGIFLPFQGKKLLDDGGFYYIGQATRGEWYADQEQTKPNSLSWSDDFINFEGKPTNGGSLYGERNRNFWKFCDLLSQSLFGGGMLETRQRWGWSNLLKIGAYNDYGAQHGPAQWGQAMRNIQREACTACLKNEISSLRRTVIYIASTEHFGICPDAFGEDMWHQEKYEAVNDTWVRIFPWNNNNIICHGPHPRFPGFMGHRARVAVAHISSLYRDLSLRR
jgi:hypothetical protein